MTDPRADVGFGYNPVNYLASALTMQCGRVPKIGERVLHVESDQVVEVVGFGGFSFGRRFGQVVDVRTDERGWWIFKYRDAFSPLIGELRGI